MRIQPRPASAYGPFVGHLKFQESRDDLGRPTGGTSIGEPP
jgi:hypothetical protein